MKEKGVGKGAKGNGSAQAGKREKIGGKEHQDITQGELRNSSHRSAAVPGICPGLVNDCLTCQVLLESCI